MSDDYIVITPVDPYFVPPSDVQEMMLQTLKAIAPLAEEVKTVLTDGVQFLSCGENFEVVSCPWCRSTLDHEWWSERMEEDHSDGVFNLNPFTLPCCRRQANLNQLSYDWVQAFGRFSWDVMNPNVGALTIEQESAIREAARDPVVIIRQHL